MAKAIFLDRDGVVNVDKPPYISRWEDIEFIPGIFDFCREAKRQGFMLFIVTNQSWINCDWQNKAAFLDLMLEMHKRFSDEGCSFADYAFCMHARDHGCDCRKPSPVMIMRLMHQYGIEAENSVMIGDQVSDIEAGIKAMLGASLYFRGDWDRMGRAIFKKREVE